MNRAPFAAARVPVFYASASPLDPLDPASAPDFDDAPKTTFDRAPYALQDTGATRAFEEAEVDEAAVETPRVAESYIRARSAEATGEGWAEASAFLDVMGELQLNLGVALLCLDDAVGVGPYDRSAMAAGETLRTRIQELVDLRDALNDLYLDATTPEIMPLFAVDAPLTAYLKGVYLWAGDVTTALADLAQALRVLQPDWAHLRQRLDNAAAWYFDGLPNEIRPELERHGARADFVAKVEEVFFAARYLAHGLEKRFG